MLRPNQRSIRPRWLAFDSLFRPGGLSHNLHGNSSSYRRHPGFPSPDFLESLNFRLAPTSFSRWGLFFVADSTLCAAIPTKHRVRI
jgi:hypothetical protein